MPKAKKYTVWDTADDPPGLVVRGRSSGTKTYALISRPDNALRAVTVTLGWTNTMKLSAARKKAWDALHQMQNGTNPNTEKRKLPIDTFGALAELYMTEELPKKRQGKAAARYLRSDWLGQKSTRTRVWEDGRHIWKTEWKPGKDPVFTNRPAALITQEEILHRLNTIHRARGAYAARHAMNAIKRTFGFAFNHGHCGIKFSPAAGLHDRNVGLSGKKMRRQRVLNADEIKAIWHASTDLGLFGILVKAPPRHGPAPG
jgi:hypothetical protein